MNDVKEVVDLFLKLVLLTNQMKLHREKIIKL